MTDLPPHTLLSLSDAAAFLGISRSNFATNYADRIPCVKPRENSERRWPVGQLVKFVEQSAKPQG